MAGKGLVGKEAGMTSSSKFVLIRWMEEETLSVLATKSVRQGQQVYAGAFGEFKWGGKFYEGEVLSLSGKLNFTAQLVRGVTVGCAR